MSTNIILDLNAENNKFPLKYFYNIGDITLLEFCIERIRRNKDALFVCLNKKEKNNEILEILTRLRVKYFFYSNLKSKINIIKKINYSSNDPSIVIDLSNPIIDNKFIKKICRSFFEKKIKNFKKNKNFQIIVGKSYSLRLSNNKFKKKLDSKIKKLLSEFNFKFNTIEDFIELNKIIKKTKKNKNTKFEFLKKKIETQRKLKKKFNKNLIILGGSHDQMATIKIANSINTNSIVFDKNIDSPGKTISSLFISRSARDAKNISNFAKKIKADGVILQGPDFPYVSSKIEKTLGITNVPIKAAKICTNKYIMKKFFKKILIPIPKFKLIYKNKNSKINFNFPVIIKPLDKSASRGVMLCKNQEELNKYKKITFSKTNKNCILVEEFLSGPQISTETFIKNKKIYTPGFVDRNYEMLEFTKPNVLENGANYPSKHREHYKQINKYIKILSQNLKIHNGVIKGDIVIHNKKIYFIEIAVRLSGGDFSESTIPLSSSFNLIKNSINLSLRNTIYKKDLKIKFKKKYYVANRYFFLKNPGKIIKIIGLNKMKTKSWIKKIKIFTKINDKLSRTTDHTNRLGVFVVEANSEELLKKRIKEVYKNIIFKIV